MNNFDEFKLKGEVRRLQNTLINRYNCEVQGFSKQVGDNLVITLTIVDIYKEEENGSKS